LQFNCFQIFLKIPTFDIYFLTFELTILISRSSFLTQDITSVYHLPLLVKMT